MFWVISLAYGIAVMAIASALAFGIIWSVERFAKRGVRRYHWRAMHTWLAGVNRPRRSPGSYLFSVRAVGAGSNKASAISTALHDHRGPPDDCLVGVGRTPWRTISSTEFSEMLNSRASSMRLTYASGCSRLGAIMAVSNARKSILTRNPARGRARGGVQYQTKRGTKPNYDTRLRKPPAQRVADLHRLTAARWWIFSAALLRQRPTRKIHRRLRSSRI
jgi:hypothetical protein